MELTEQKRESAATIATNLARCFLDRWRDPWTRAARDDCAQETVIRALERLPIMRDETRFPALVRTIARRMRYREIVDRRRLGLASLEAGSLRCERAAAKERVDGYRVRGEVVEKRWLLGALEDALSVLCPLNRGLLRGYYEGFSCRELAERYGIEEECVKVRLHRGRKKIKRELEDRAIAASDCSW